MHDVNEIARAMAKDPTKWAQMFLETRQTLDMSIVELTAAKQAEGEITSVFDSVRARSFAGLLTFMTRHMTLALVQERELKKTKNVFSLSVAGCDNDDLLTLRGLINTAQEVVTDYANLRGLGEGKAALDPKLRANNPCRVVYSNTSHLADAEGIVHYNSPIEGLTVALSAVNQAVLSNPSAFTYRQFMYNWFQTDSKCYQKAERACQEFSNPDAIVLRSVSYIIALARAIIVASFESPVDINYIQETYTLEAYVEASKNI